MACLDQGLPPTIEYPLLKKDVTEGEAGLRFGCSGVGLLSREGRPKGENALKQFVRRLTLFGTGSAELHV